MSTRTPCNGAARHRDAGRRGLHPAAQALEHQGEGRIALGGFQAEVGNGDPPPGDGGGGPKIGGAGGVGLDLIIPGRIALASRQLKIPVAFPVIRDAEVPHNFQGQVHVGAGNQVAGDRKLQPGGGQGPDEQQGRDVLAADGPGQAGPAALEAALDQDRGAAVAFLRHGLNPQLRKGRQQLPQGPLAEAFRAGEQVLALPQGGERREQAHGSAGVAQVDGLGNREPAAAGALNPQRGVLPFNGRPQARQRLGRQLGVLGLQGVHKHAFPRSQRRGHQGPVSVALGAGQGEGGLDRLTGFDFFSHGSLSQYVGWALPTIIEIGDGQCPPYTS